MVTLSLILYPSLASDTHGSDLDDILERVTGKAFECYYGTW